MGGVVGAIGDVAGAVGGFLGSNAGKAVTSIAGALGQGARPQQQQGQEYPSPYQRQPQSWDPFADNPIAASYFRALGQSGYSPTWTNLHRGGWGGGYG